MRYKIEKMPEGDDRVKVTPYEKSKDDQDNDIWMPKQPIYYKEPTVVEARDAKVSGLAELDNPTWITRKKAAVQKEIDHLNNIISKF